MVIKNDSLFGHYNIIVNAFKVVDISNQISMYAKPKDNSQEVYIELFEPSETVIDLLSADAPQDDIWEQMDKDEDRYCIVRDNKITYGYIDITTYNDEDKTAKEVAIPIHPDDLVPGTMSLLDLIKLFKKKQFFFVLSGNKITHSVSYRDLDKIPAKLCIFSILLRLESEMLELLTNTRPIKNHLKNLESANEKRFQRLISQCETIYGKDKISAKKILLHTNFSDKIIMINKDEFLYNKIFEDKIHGKNFLNMAKDVRNSIAHDQLILNVLTNPKIFNGFLDILKKVTQKIKSINI